MRLWIVNLHRDAAFEVLEYQPERTYAVLLAHDGTRYEDKNFRLGEVKRFYRITQTQPKFWKGSGHAEQPGLSA